MSWSLISTQPKKKTTQSFSFPERNRKFFCDSFSFVFSRQKRFYKEARLRKEDCSYFVVGWGQTHMVNAWPVDTRDRNEYKDKIEEFLVKTTKKNNRKKSDLGQTNKENIR